jgi:hypothetical protein
MKAPRSLRAVAPVHHDAVVDRRRARGRLLGIRAGNQMLHPAWQLDPRRRDTLPGLCLGTGVSAPYCVTSLARGAVKRRRAIVGPAELGSGRS